MTFLLRWQVHSLLGAPKHRLPHLKSLMVPRVYVDSGADCRDTHLTEHDPLPALENVRNACQSGHERRIRSQTVQENRLNTTTFFAACSGSRVPQSILPRSRAANFAMDFNCDSCSNMTRIHHNTRPSNLVTLDIIQLEGLMTTMNTISYLGTLGGSKKDRMAVSMASTSHD